MVGADEGVGDRGRDGARDRLPPGIVRVRPSASRWDVGVFVDREVPTVDQHVALPADLPHRDVESVDVIGPHAILRFVEHRGERGQHEVGLAGLTGRIRDSVQIATQIGDAPGRPDGAIGFHHVAEIGPSDRDVNDVRAKAMEQVDDSSRDRFQPDERLVAPDHRHGEGDVGLLESIDDRRAEIPAGFVGHQQHESLVVPVTHVPSVGCRDQGNETRRPVPEPLMPFRPRRALERSTPLVRSVVRPLGLFLSVALLSACSSTPEKPDYERELPPGRVALEPVRAGGEPDLEAAWYRRDDGLRAAVDQSLSWFAAPSSQQWWPYETADRSISHEDARRSVERFGELLDQSRTAADFRRSVLEEFQIYQSVGWNGEGVVLYTGYYTPEFQASPVRTARFTRRSFAGPPTWSPTPRPAGPSAGVCRMDGSSSARPGGDRGLGSATATSSCGSRRHSTRTWFR